MPPLAPPDPATFDDLTERERAGGLAGGPVRLDRGEVLAWIDCDGHPENVLTRDELLDNVMLYWLPGTGASSARLHWQSIRQVNRWISSRVTDTVAVPTGCSISPKELAAPVAALGGQALPRHPLLERPVLPPARREPGGASERWSNERRTKPERRRTTKRTNTGVPGPRLWVTTRAWGRVD